MTNPPKQVFPLNFWRIIKKNTRLFSRLNGWNGWTIFYQLKLVNGIVLQNLHATKLNILSIEIPLAPAPALITGEVDNGNDERNHCL